MFSGYRGSFPVVKRPGREADHSPLSSAEDMNEWRCTSITCLNGVLHVTQYRPPRRGFLLVVDVLLKYEMCVVNAKSGHAQNRIPPPPASRLYTFNTIYNLCPFSNSVQ
jgi:hypothetical protein